MESLIASVSISPAARMRIGPVMQRSTVRVRTLALHPHRDRRQITVVDTDAPAGGGYRRAGAGIQRAARQHHIGESAAQNQVGTAEQQPLQPQGAVVRL